MKHRPRPRTALIVAAMRRKAGWKRCTHCDEPKPPEEFRKWRNVCVPCDNKQRAQAGSKWRQEVVRVPVKGWGCRV